MQMTVRTLSKRGVKLGAGLHKCKALERKLWGIVEVRTMEVRIVAHVGFVRSDCRLGRMV